MATVLDKGAVALADKLGLDLRPAITKAPPELPTARPCRCLGGAWLWAHEPERCFRCGRFLDSAIGDLYSDQESGALLLHARVEVERIRVLREFEAADADDYEAWLEARLRATEASLERLCMR
jgi:hypothetical protein